MKTSSKITTKINNQIYEIEGEKAFSPLASFLRNEALLCGTKVVCSEGDCGACTVLIADQVDKEGKLKFRAVNSCILPLYLTNGAQVVTVEGIGESKEMGFNLHEVQKKMIDFNGAQCGYCTPGFICSMTSAIDTVKQEGGVLTEKKAKNFLTGNLCRCTGYKPILEALINVDLDNVNLLSERYKPDQDWQLKMETVSKRNGGH
jgi:xanthine dehydrogenase small subunit